MPGERAIAGELYRVDDFARLDEFEGDGYVRAEIDLVGAPRAHTYLASAPEAGIALPGEEWPM